MKRFYLLLFSCIFISTSVFAKSDIRVLHTKIIKVNIGNSIDIKANIINTHLVNYIILHYKNINDKEWSEKEMSPKDGMYSASISPKEMGKVGLVYYIEVIDTESKSIKGFVSKNNPQYIDIVERDDKNSNSTLNNSNKLNTEDQEFTDEFAVFLEDETEEKIVSASKQAEPIKEAPVPVTVITSKMIKNSGLNNLKDILVTYVPGLTFSQDHNEVNVSMRGVYASSQQKILIMRDGFRLNNRAYSEANPDYSISIDNIKQIEVLRGPASSIYGNIALTAVINIITKDGKDLEGFQSSVSVGNFGQKNISLLYGKSFDKKNPTDGFTLWVSAYKADGEKIFIDEDEARKYTPASNNALSGDVIVGGFKNMPSYDIGFKYSFNDFKILYSIRSSTMIEPFNASGNAQVYEYDNYSTIEGYGRGLASDFQHLNLSYNIDLSRNTILTAQGYFDLSTVRVNLVADPDPNSQKFYNISWDEYAFGAVLQVMHNYTLGGKGTLLVGAQVDSMKLYDSLFLIGTDGVLNQAPFYYEPWDSYGKVLEEGKETVYSGFAQLKHKFFEGKLILNLGARFDYKNRHKGDSVSDFSPRVSLIYIPNKTFDTKLSFSRSFVDAPYWYRYNNLASYKGSEDLKPEHLDSIQFTPSLSLLDGKLKATTNVFYNHLTDFIYRDPDPAATVRYHNAGMLKSFGVEEEISWIEKDLQIRANVTYQSVIDFEDYAVTDKEVHNVPSFTGNLILDVNTLGLIGVKSSNLWLNATFRYISSQLSPINSTEMMENRIDAAFLVNLGLRYEYKKVFADFRVKNLLDTKHEAGGSVPHPYPQEGRWFFVKLGYLF